MKNNLKYTVSFILSFSLSYTIYYILNGSINLFPALVLSLLSSLLIISYKSKESLFYLLAVGILAMIGADLISIRGTSQILGISLVISMLLVSGILDKSIKEKPKAEIERDYMQMLLGFVVIIMVIMGYLRLLVFLAILGILLLPIVYRSNMRLSRFLKSLRRRKVMFDTGALYIAIGTILSIGFIKNIDFLFFTLFALFFSDSLATIVGLNRKKIGHKSLAGSAAFFVSLSLVGFYLIGDLGLIFAMILALIERFSPIDDNLTIPAGSIFLYYGAIILM